MELFEEGVTQFIEAFILRIKWNCKFHIMFFAIYVQMIPDN